MPGRRLYLSGGITGVPDYRERFKALGALVASWGDTPVDPRRVPACPDGSCVESEGDPRSNGHTWACWLRYDLIAMLQCDGVVVMDNWRGSRGASLEVSVAQTLRLPVIFVDEHGAPRWPA